MTDGAASNDAADATQIAAMSSAACHPSRRAAAEPSGPSTRAWRDASTAIAAAAPDRARERGPGGCPASRLGEDEHDRAGGERGDGAARGGQVHDGRRARASSPTASAPARPLARQRGAQQQRKPERHEHGEAVPVVEREAQRVRSRWAGARRRRGPGTSRGRGGWSAPRGRSPRSRPRGRRARRRGGARSAASTTRT